jgi:hypothetical protein
VTRVPQAMPVRIWTRLCFTMDQSECDVRVLLLLCVMCFLQISAWTKMWIGEFGFMTITGTRRVLARARALSHAQC